MMTVAVFLLFSFFQGTLCQQWSAFMPQSIEALSGSCVNIPCSFNFPSNYKIDASCKAIWRRGTWRSIVFVSSLTGENPNLNILQGKLTGDLYERDCTTVFYNLTSNDYNNYYFRLDCDRLKFSYQSNVEIKSKDSLPRPTVTPSRVEVDAGTLVTLSCSASSPCPILAPNLTWTPTLGDTVEILGTNIMTSVMNFTASYLHNSLRISCSALYKRQDGSEDLSFEKSLTISVMYPPINTSSSSPGSVQEHLFVTLTCTSMANPRVYDYTWYQVNSDQVFTVGSQKLLTTRVSEDNSKFYCEARNKLGAQNSSVIQIDVQFPPKKTAVIINPTGPLLEGSSLILTCASHANPVVTNYTWYKMDDGSGIDIEESRQTFTIESANPAHSGEYFCVAKNDLGEENSPAVLLDIHYPPKNTSVSADRSGPVLDGSSVTLSCNSIANPAVQNYTWYRVWGDKQEAVGSDQDFTFNASKLLSDKYYCEAYNVHGVEASEPISVAVTFAAVILPSSRCVKILSKIKCSCESQGNPPPSVVWELAGEPVNHSDAIPVREVAVGSTSVRSMITLHLPAEDTPTLVCLSSNSVGFDSRAFNVSSSEIQLGYHTLSLLIGCAVGVVVMMLLCGVLQIILWKKKKHSLSPNRELVDNSELIYGSSSTPVDVVFANKAMVDGDEECEEESLHYASVDFAKLQAKSRGDLGEGEIRGLASRTSEYATIRLQSRGRSVGDAEDEG